MQDARVRTALILVCLACLLGSTVVLFAGHPSAPPAVVITPPAEVTVPARHRETSGVPTKSTTRIYVDVAGCVRRPSLYTLPAESRVMQAILAAGGPTGEADLTAINLAQKITDGEKVFVPKQSAIPSHASFAPDEAAAIPAEAPPMQSAKKNGKSTRTGHGRKITPESGEQIDLNTATEEQLERLPSVGPSMAERILTYRQQAGSFGKIEDLMQVTGIGPKKFAKIAPFVKL